MQHRADFQARRSHYVPTARVVERDLAWVPATLGSVSTHGPAISRELHVGQTGIAAQVLTRGRSALLLDPRAARAGGAAEQRRAVLGEARAPAAT